MNIQKHASAISLQRVTHPRVGVGVIIVKDNKVLMGERKNSHGNGSWAFPGGHLEFGESWEECARREVKEETGLNIANIRFGSVTNDLFVKENKHYITIFMIADYIEGEPQVLEPHKCSGWQWFEWNEMPKPLFLTIENLVIQGFNLSRIVNNE
jgi:8-oxo-dGTP diphosphatase